MVLIIGYHAGNAPLLRRDDEHQDTSNSVNSKFDSMYPSRLTLNHYVFSSQSRAPHSLTCSSESKAKFSIIKVLKEPRQVPHSDVANFTARLSIGK